MPLVFNDDQAAKLIELLGLPDDTNVVPEGAKPDEAMVAIADTILEVVADLAKNERDSKGEKKPSEIAAAAGRLGMTVIDTDSLTKLHADADEGRQIKAAAARAKVESNVDDAIRHGKITPARRDHWVNLITADPGMADVLASVPNETAVPLNEIGHSAGESDDLTDTPAWFR